MQTVRTILWVALAVLLVVFAMYNWEPVTVRFWPGMVMETRLPVLLAVAFVLGSLPFWLAHRVTRYRMGRRVETTERELAIYRNTVGSSDSAATPAPTPLAAEPAATPAPTPEPTSSPFVEDAERP